MGLRTSLNFRSRSASPRRSRSVSLRRSRSASLRRSRSGSITDRDPAQGRDQDPGLFHDQEAADQNPDLHLLKEVVPHQEVHTEVQVQKEWTEVLKFTR